MKNLDKTGFWWNPETPTDRWSGSLSFDWEKGTFLRVTAEHNAQALPPELRRYKIIHGLTVSGESISLLDCFDQRVQGGFHQLHSREIFANRLICGMHVSEVDPSFTAVSVVLSNLGTWLWRTGFDVTIADDAKVVDISYKEAEPIALYGDDEFTIDIASGLTRLSIWPDSSGNLDFTETVRVELRANRPQPLSLFQERIRAIQDFFSVACLAYCGVEELIVFRSKVSNCQSTTGGSFHAVPVLRPRPQRLPHPKEMLFTYSDVQDRLQDLVAAWILKADEIRPIRALFMSVSYGDHYLDTKLLFLAQAAEALHRRIAGGTYYSADEYEDNVLPGLTHSLPPHLTPEFTCAIKDRLKYANEYSLRRRLKELVERHFQLLSRFFSEPRDITAAIVQYRNDLTHHPVDARRSPDDTSKMINCIDFLQLLLELSFASIMGFSDAEISDLANSCGTYKRRFELP